MFFRSKAAPRVRNVIAMEGWPVPNDGRSAKVCCQRSHVLSHFMFSPTFSELDPPKARTFELYLNDFELENLVPSKEEEESYWVSCIRARLESFNALMFGWTSAFVMVH